VARELTSIRRGGYQQEQSDLSVTKEKNAPLVLSRPEYRPKSRRTAIHGQDAHATKYCRLFLAVNSPVLVIAAAVR
jgi:hypothetical protein